MTGIGLVYGWPANPAAGDKHRVSPSRFAPDHHCTPRPARAFNAPDGRQHPRNPNTEATPKQQTEQRTYGPEEDTEQARKYTLNAHEMMPYEMENCEVQEEPVPSDAIFSTDMQYVVQWYLQRDGQNSSWGMSA